MINQAIQKAMCDSQGNNKGYFTYGELAFNLFLIPNGGWTYLKMDEDLEQWKREGNIIEIEPGGKYKPVIEKAKSRGEESA